MKLLAPFPYFGGKSRAADEIWQRFGNVDNYVEPFAGSLAVLLARPSAPTTETINDKDRFLANFWRATQAAPDDVAEHADWPINEADLEARHYWLMTEGVDRLTKLSGDPLGYDTQIAGWWVWGACAWIGSGWCSGKGPWRWTECGWADDAGGRGINRKLPHMTGGRGINRKLFTDLADRLRRVRVACGDWERVVGPSVTWRNGLTAVFLDPPYSSDCAEVYSNDSDSLARDVATWAFANGDNADMRIALCGYEGEHNIPASWSTWRWKAAGGYGSQGDGRGRANARKECVWFSPHCVDARQTSLLELA